MIIIAVLTALAFILYSRLFSDKSQVLVIVLGDLGRSPRMQAHIGSLLDRDLVVHVITYKESSSLSNQIKGKIRIHSVSHAKGSFVKRVLIQTTQMGIIALRLSTVKSILIQVAFQSFTFFIADAF